MDRVRVRNLAQYTLAVAGQEDDFQSRELGPIHLVKYLFLADLAYAEQNEGQSYLGVPWTFYHFGPWCAELYQELPSAVRAAGADERHASSRYADDFVRWKLDDGDLVDRLEADLPTVISATVKRNVHAYGSDTAGLLHHVYRTRPMVNAAPGEALLLGIAATRPAPRRPTEPQPVLSRRQQELQRTKRDALRSRFLQSVAASRGSARVTPSPPPRYDAVFLNGHPVDQVTPPFTDADAEFVDTIWKSDLRTDPDVP